VERVADRRYIEILEKTNAQLSLSQTPYGIAFAAISTLFTVGAIVFAAVLWLFEARNRRAVRESAERAHQKTQDQLKEAHRKAQEELQRANDAHITQLQAVATQYQETLDGLISAYRARIEEERAEVRGRIEEHRKALSTASEGEKQSLLEKVTTLERRLDALRSTRPIAPPPTAAAASPARAPSGAGVGAGTSPTVLSALTCPMPPIHSMFGPPPGEVLKATIADGSFVSARDWLLNPGSSAALTSKPYTHLGQPEPFPTFTAGQIIAAPSKRRTVLDTSGKVSYVYGCPKCGADMTDPDPPGPGMIRVGPPIEVRCVNTAYAHTARVRNF
jgi:hypothetical protein